MQALRIEAEVSARGTLKLPRLALQKGTPVEVIVLVPNRRDDFEDLKQASTTSLDFWDNPTDDEVWNDA